VDRFDQCEVSPVRLISTLFALHSRMSVGTKDAACRDEQTKLRQSFWGHCYQREGFGL
jgi:hypothetical protein